MLVGYNKIYLVMFKYIYIIVFMKGESGMIHIRFFAGLAERTGCTETRLEIGPLTVGELLAELSRLYPNVSFEGLLVAVDEVCVGKDRLVNSESEVALLPPIAGG